MFEGDFNIEHNTDNEEGDDYNQSFTHFTFSGGRRSSASLTSICVLSMAFRFPPIVCFCCLFDIKFDTSLSSLSSSKAKASLLILS